MSDLYGGNSQKTINISNCIPLDGETTFSDIYKSLSGFGVKNGSKYLCESCSEELLSSYELRKKIEECEVIWSAETKVFDETGDDSNSMEEVEIEIVPETENEVVIEVAEHVDLEELDDAKMEEHSLDISSTDQDRKSLSMMDMNTKPEGKVHVFEQEFDRYSVDQLHKLLDEKFPETLAKQAKWLITKIENGKISETISAKSVLLKNFGVQYKKLPKCGVCPFCGKRVARANSLPRHIAIHQRGTRPETRGRKRVKEQQQLQQATNQPKRVRPILPAPTNPLSPLIVSTTKAGATPPSQAANVPKFLLLLPSIPTTPTVPIKVSKLPVTKIAPKIDKEVEPKKS